MNILFKGFLLGFSIYFFILPSLASAEPWWNSSWTYKKQVNITNNNATVALEQNYTINVTANFTQLILDSKMNATGNDTRIVWWNGTNNIELDRINTTAFNVLGTNTVLWFRLQRNISANGWDANYSLYYGNPNAGSAPANESNVFIRRIDDAVSLWHFESANATNHTADANIKNKNDGKLVKYICNPATCNFTAGKFGNALQFDGTDDFVNAGNDSSLNFGTGDFSFGVWIKIPPNITRDNDIISKYDEPNVRGWAISSVFKTFDLYPKLAVSNGSNNIEIWPDKKIDDGVWHHVAGVRSSTIKLYVDGNLENETSITIGSVNNVENLTIGFGNYQQDYFNGTIDEVTIFNRALSPAEVSDLYGSYGDMFATRPGSVYARKYLSPEPSAVLGTEQPQDSTPPQITITSPTNQTYATNNIWFNVTLNESGSVVLAQYAGINHTLTNTTGKWWHQNTSMSDGSYFVKFYANDTAGNMNSSTVFFTVDTTPPSISIQSPANTTYATTSVWANITLNEAGSWCGRSLDSGSNVTLSNTTGNWNNLMSVSDGSHNVKFFCNDTTGNMENSTTRYFSVNTTPSLNISLKPTKSWWNDLINASGAILASGQSLSDITVTVELNNQIKCTDQTDSSGLWTCTFNAPNELGSYTVRANITLSGNSTSSTTTLKVAPSWGYVFSGIANRFAHQVPMLIQEPSGRIHWVWVTVVVGIA